MRLVAGVVGIRTNGVSLKYYERTEHYSQHGVMPLKYNNYGFEYNKFYTLLFFPLLHPLIMIQHNSMLSFIVSVCE